MEDFNKAINDLINESNIITSDDEENFTDRLKDIHDTIINQMGAMYDDTLYRIQKQRKMQKHQQKIMKHIKKYFDEINSGVRLAITYGNNESLQSLIIKSMTITLDPLLTGEIIENNETIPPKDDSNKTIMNPNGNISRSILEQLKMTNDDATKQIEQSDELINNHDETELIMMMKQKMMIIL
jgi:hypothetical protein